MTPEKRVQNPIIKYLNELEKEGKKIIHERRQAGGVSYKKGIPDLYAVINGRHLEIEVKAPNGSLDPMQEKWRDKCIRLGIDYICVDDFEKFKSFLQEKYKL